GIERVLERWQQGTPGGVDLADGVRAVLQGGWVALDREPRPVEPMALSRDAFERGEVLAADGGDVRLGVSRDGRWRPDGAHAVGFGASDWPEDVVLRRADPEG